jgi:hypothetical protein
VPKKDLLPTDPARAGKQAAAELEAYRKVLQASGLLARLTDHPAAQRFTVPELLAVMPLDMEGMAEDERERWRNSLAIAGADIPYHPSWCLAYPQRVATYPYQELLSYISRDIERYEQQYPYLFSGNAGGYELIYDALVAARNPQLDHLLQQAEAHHRTQLERAEWLASRSGTEKRPKAPAPSLLYFSEELPGLKKPPLVEWMGSKADFVELGYALIESGMLKISAGRANTLKALADMFNLTIDKPEKHLQTIKKRQQGANMAPLLGKLLEAFLRWLDSSSRDRT